MLSRGLLWTTLSLASMVEKWMVGLWKRLLCKVLQCALAFNKMIILEMLPYGNCTLCETHPNPT